MMLAETKTSEQHQRPNHVGPVRTCAGCTKRAPACELVRVVINDAGMLAVDLANSRFGRGAHVHPSIDCLSKALQGGFARAFKTSVTTSSAELAAQIVISANRRIEGLVSGARRARHAVAGADTVQQALHDGTAKLVMVACDAAAAAKLPEIQRAIFQGTAIVWGHKACLGAVFGCDEVAVCAVLHEGVAAAILSAHRASQPFLGVARSEAWWCPEVR
jgi:predicted RNA-binding protein YlxR (DUF448 family)/ribosomal protein L7Ae-like RNA K-turn-binding protein